jgi:hypothetical protein
MDGTFVQYVVVFDMAGESYPAPVMPLLLAGSFALALGGCALWLTFAVRLSPLLRRVRFYSAGIALGLCVVLLAMRGIENRHNDLVESASSGKVRVVEGVVESFHPMPAAGHDTERFTVAGESFAYSDYEITGGFNNAASHGGPLRAGLPVRITFVQESSRNVIVKLEVGRT